MANVFISYRTVDHLVAERLAVALRSRGHVVWLDTWNIAIGDSIVERVNKGLLTSAYLLLCYSDSGSMSPWISREWMSVLARQLDGAHIRLLPVRLTGGAPPPILADLKYADLVSDWSGGIDALCDALTAGV